jgi:AcrR family transcriptional regulator
LPSDQPKLDRDVIVGAAIGRAERHGLGELSARKLAQDLGCEAMSLYHHVGSMETLKDLMVDRLLGSITPATAINPAQALSEESQAYLELAVAHARIFVLVATRRWKGERAVATAMRTVGYLGDLGFGPADALARARALGAYLNGAGLALAAWATDPDNPKPNDARQVKSDLLRGLDLFLSSLTKASDSVEN